MQAYILAVWLLAASLTGSCLAQNSDNAEHGKNTLVELQKTSQLLSAISDRLTSLDERLDSFDQRLESLSVDVSQHDGDIARGMSDLKAEMKVLSAQLNHTQESKPDVPFRITRVERREAVGFYQITVLYEGSRRPQVLFKRDRYLPPTPLEDQGHLGQGELVVYKRSSRYSTDDPVLSFVLPDRSVELTLNLDSDDSAMDVPRTNFQILQGSDVTFKPGENPQADFFFETEGKYSRIDEDDIGLNALVKTSDEKVSRFRESRIYVHNSTFGKLKIVGFGGKSGHHFGRIIVNSTSDIEGVVEIKVSYYISRYKPVSKITNLLSFGFYREDHYGPFPDDFIGFVVDSRQQASSVEICNLGSPLCFISCEAAGNHLSGVDIVKEGPSGEAVATNAFTVRGNHWARSHLMFPNATLEDSGNYSCTARSPTQQAVRNLTLFVLEKPQFNHNFSTITKLDNGSFLMTCLAEGRPAPNVTIGGIYRSDDHYTIHVTHPSQSETRTDMLAKNMEDFKSIHGIFCYAAISVVAGFRLNSDEFWNYFEYPPESYVDFSNSTSEE